MSSLNFLSIWFLCDGFLMLHHYLRLGSSQHTYTYVLESSIHLTSYLVAGVIRLSLGSVFSLLSPSGLFIEDSRSSRIFPVLSNDVVHFQTFSYFWSHPSSFLYISYTQVSTVRYYYSLGNESSHLGAVLMDDPFILFIEVIWYHFSRTFLLHFFLLSLVV